MDTNVNRVHFNRWLQLVQDSFHDSSLVKEVKSYSEGRITIVSYYFGHYCIGSIFNPLTLEARYDINEDNCILAIARSGYQYT